MQHPCLPLAGRNKVHKKRELSVNSPCLACAVTGRRLFNKHPFKKECDHIAPRSGKPFLQAVAPPVFNAAAASVEVLAPAIPKFGLPARRHAFPACSAAPGDRDFAPSPTACPRRPGRAWEHGQSPSSSNFPPAPEPALPRSDGVGPPAATAVATGPNGRVAPLLRPRLWSAPAPVVSSPPARRPRAPSVT